MLTLSELDLSNGPIKLTYLVTLWTQARNWTQTQARNWTQTQARNWTRTQARNWTRTQARNWTQTHTELVFGYFSRK